MEIGTLLNNFLDLLTEVLTLHQTKIKVLTKNINLDRVNNYKKILNNPDISTLDHGTYFTEPFKLNKLKILSQKDDSWLKDGDITIGWVKDQKDYNPKYSLALSVIHNKAIELKNQCIAQAKLIPLEKIGDYFPEALYPERILFEYYNIVYWFLSHDNTGEKMANLNQDVVKFGVLVDIYKSKVKPSKSVTVSEGKEEVSPQSNPMNGFDLNSMFNTMKSTPAIAKLFDRMRDSKGKSPSDLLSGMIKDVLNPETVQDVAKSFGMEIPKESFGNVQAVVDAVKGVTEGLGKIDFSKLEKTEDITDVATTLVSSVPTTTDLVVLDTPEEPVTVIMDDETF